ncbi:MAG: cytidine deaminase [Deltaproteobacteria bacterium]|nr:cytidine deaminase [Deltaproteobacteria bacterium]
MRTNPLIKSAIEAVKQAHAPYSRFLVGAALLTKEGTIFPGCNIEAGVPIGICAERAALCNAVIHGEKQFLELAIYTKTRTHTSPCGVCRQMLSEFSRDLMIHSVNEKKEVVTWRLSDLLPYPFIAEEAGAYSRETGKK